MARHRVVKYWNRLRHRVSRISLPIEHWGREHYIPLLPNELLSALKHVSDQLGTTSDPASDLLKAEVQQACDVDLRASESFSAGVQQLDNPAGSRQLDNPAGLRQLDNADDSISFASFKPVSWEELESAATCFKQLIRLKYRLHHERLMDLYSKFDPDRDVFDRLPSLAIHQQTQSNTPKSNLPRQAAKSDPENSEPVMGHESASNEFRDSEFLGQEKKLADSFDASSADKDTFAEESKTRQPGVRPGEHAEKSAEKSTEKSAAITSEKTSQKTSERNAQIRSLFSEVTDALYHANYRRLSPKQIQNAVEAASHWGVRLRIRFSSFRRLEVYARGDIQTRKKVRVWRSFFRLTEVDVPIYQRLVVVFWPKDLQAFSEPLDPRRIHIRMFKNVPKADIDMMLPGTQVKLNWLDRGMIGIPTLWGIFVMSSRLAKSLWVLALLGTMKIVSSTMLIIAFAIATAFYGIKSFFSYSSAKRRYLLDVTRNLYYQNLDNNLGAVLRIEEEAEQQEVCEAIVAYFVLNIAGKPLEVHEIDRIAEKILTDILGTPVDFDVQDAVRDLLRLGAIQHEEHGWTIRDSFVPSAMG